MSEQFGRLTVIGEASRSATGKRKVLCRCACGSERVVQYYDLRRGATTSCGCRKVEVTIRRNTTHGESKTSSEYNTWLAMRKRCLNPAEPAYKNYGGRGITVCDRWLESYESFLEDVGRKPSADHSIDRIDNDGNYEPGNVRWATRTEQSANRRTVRWITFEGRTQHLKAWARERGISHDAIRHRLDELGWSLERALTERPRLRAPVRNKRQALTSF